MRGECIDKVRTTLKDGKNHTLSTHPSFRHVLFLFFSPIDSFQWRRSSLQIENPPFVKIKVQRRKKDSIDHGLAKSCASVTQQSLFSFPDSQSFLVPCLLLFIHFLDLTFCFHSGKKTHTRHYLTVCNRYIYLMPDSSTGSLGESETERTWKAVGLFVVLHR
jgi:hypothetical protein